MAKRRPRHSGPQIEAREPIKVTAEMQDMMMSMIVGYAVSQAIKKFPPGIRAIEIRVIGEPGDPHVPLTEPEAT